MSTLLYIVAILGIIVVAFSAWVLATTIQRELKKIGDAGAELSETAKKLNREIAPVAQNASVTLNNMDRLALQLTETAERVDRLASQAEGLLDASQVATSATKAAKSAASELISVYEGVKQGIKTLRGS